jgi:choline monooxygenase
MDSFFIDSDIRKAHTLHTDFYTQPVWYEAAKSIIFARSWQFLGDTDQLKSNNIVPVTVLPDYLDEPLILVRDKEDTIRCLSNVCTHRGNLVAWESHQSTQLRCRYHGRLFDLAGRIKFMPEFEGVENFPCEADHLQQLPLFQVGKLLFTSLNTATLSAPFFKAMLDRISWMPLGQMVFRADLSQTYQVKANWALYCENYLEGFHIPFVHPGLSAVIDYGHYSTEMFDCANLQLGIAKKGDACFDLPPESPDFGRQVAAYYFWVFPNLMFNFYPWGLSLNVVEPTGISATQVRFLVYVWDESKLEQGAGASLDQVEMEDEAVVEHVQAGIRSRFYSRGRYAPEREQGTHHFHQLISRFLTTV